MNRYLGFRHCLNLQLAILLAVFSSSVPAQSSSPDDDRAIRQVLARFYDGWNTHDVEKMVSVYAEDVDHINVFAEWHKGKESIGQDLRLLHNGQKKRLDGTIAPAGTKSYTIEKIRFIKPDVAVVQVRSISMVGNLGTYVMTKRENGTWFVVSFTNVNYELPKTSR
jgi:uncharacterized protein (TIGR02246 family)